MGDFQEKIVKACIKNRYCCVRLSSLLNFQGKYLYYNPGIEKDKYENYLWKFSLDVLDSSSNAASAIPMPKFLSDLICSLSTQSEHVFIYFDIYSLKLFELLKKNLSCEFELVLNDAGKLECMAEAGFREIMYNNPIIKTAFTKKSSIKNIISDIISAKPLENKWAYVPDLMGLDIAMNKTGVACKARNINGEEKILFGLLKTKATELDVNRHVQILNNVLNVPVVDCVGNGYFLNIKLSSKICVEGGALDATRGAFRIGMFSGMLLGELVREKPKEFLYVAPMTLKKHITGYGRSGKTMMIEVIKEKMGINVEIDDNQADALSLLYCVLHPEIEDAIRHRAETRKAAKSRRRKRLAERRRAVNGS